MPGKDYATGEGIVATIPLAVIGITQKNGGNRSWGEFVGSSSEQIGITEATEYT